MMRSVKSGGRIAARAAIGSCIPLLAALWCAPAGAAIVETVTIENLYGVGLGSEPFVDTKIGRTKETLYVGQDVPGEQSEAGVNYTAFANNNGFFFLHDNYCVGSCATFSQTTITFTIFNDGEGAANLRFDSLITPGHIAQLTGGFAQGSFDFRVTQSSDSSEGTDLYSASGGVSSDGIFLNTGGLEFNGLNRQADENGRWEVLDWSATALSIPLLTIGAFETATLTYTATYQVFGNGSCESVLDCSGVQVVFGDPRNNGGVNFARGSLADDIYPVIGRDYDATFIPVQVVDANDPLPTNPVAAGPWNYSPLFDPRVLGVPEPATWAMMIGGFALVGGAARRRRTLVAA